MRIPYILVVFFFSSDELLAPRYFPAVSVAAPLSRHSPRPPRLPKMRGVGGIALVHDAPETSTIRPTAFRRHSVEFIPRGGWHSPRPPRLPKMRGFGGNHSPQAGYGAAAPALSPQAGYGAAAPALSAQAGFGAAAPTLCSSGVWGGSPNALPKRGLGRQPQLGIMPYFLNCRSAFLLFARSSVVSRVWRRNTA